MLKIIGRNGDEVDVLMLGSADSNHYVGLVANRRCFAASDFLWHVLAPLDLADGSFDDPGRRGNCEAAYVSWLCTASQLGTYRCLKDSEQHPPHSSRTQEKSALKSSDHSVAPESTHMTLLRTPSPRTHCGGVLGGERSRLAGCSGNRNLGSSDVLGAVTGDLQLEGAL